jgi:hypothetical protein
MGTKQSSAQPDTVTLGDTARRVALPALIGGIVAISIAAGMGQGDWARFQRAYLTAFMYILSITLGSLWFVTIQHLTNSKWSVVVRRVAEIFAANMHLVWLLSLGVVVPMLFGHSDLYVWLDEHKVHADHVLHHKAPYLNRTFFGIRWVLYFAFWTWVSRRFLTQSVRQDEVGGLQISNRLQRLSAPVMILFALSLTFCAIDLVMSLEPTWFSTMFGVYFFAGCVVAGYSLLAVALVWLQSRGCLVKSVNREHYHDIGKMMFAFTVFWTYIAFSQFMLIWYADVPEETHWYRTRMESGWLEVSIALGIVHFVLPFFGLMSRHVKRHKPTLTFWACWILLEQYLDMYWLIYPQQNVGPVFGPLEVLCWLGMVAVFVGAALLQAEKVSLLAKGDPRLPQSLAFENY